MLKKLMLLSRNNKSPDEPYLHLLKEVGFRPVFILGNPRSGTTLLYNLLVQTECFNFLSSYHVINYNDILYNHLNLKETEVKDELDRHFKSLGLDNRMFDEIVVSSDMPEEYGFVLRNSGYWYKLSSKSLPLFIEMCKKVKFVSARDRQLLLKSPLDYPNFMYLKSSFPEAKFIFIDRYPVHMINSILKAVRYSLETMNPVYALIQKDYAKLFKKPVTLSIARFMVSSRFNLGLRIFTRYYAGTIKYFFRNISSLPESDYISVRYEDLCDEPEMNLNRILEFLRVEPRTSMEYREIVKPRPVKLLEEVKRKEETILKRFADYLVYFKYNTISN